MSVYRTIFYVGVAGLILMAVNSAVLTQVQLWVTHFSANHYSVAPEKRSGSPALLRTSSSMKLISSSQSIAQQASDNSQQPLIAESFNHIEQVPEEETKAAQPFIKTSVPVSPTSMDSPEPKTFNLPMNESPASLPELVLYPDEIVIAFPKKMASTENIKKVVSRVLLSNAPLAETNLLKTQPIDLKQRPYFYRRVLDQHQAPVRYPVQAFKYADYLIEHHTEEYQDDAGRFITLHIPLVEYGITGLAKNYQAWVENYAKEFKIPPSLVYAVMETESAFNPHAVSRSNAIGLMQIKAEAAGKDVYQYVDAKPGQPSLSELFDSKSNIRMGTAYLGLLKHDYLANIVDDRIKQMVTISSYNGGLRTVLELFGKTPETATQQLNRMSPKQVYRKLRFEHQSDETRRYLDKVLKAEIKYRDLLKAV